MLRQNKIKPATRASQLRQKMLHIAKLERQLKAESEQLAEHKLQIAEQEQRYTEELERQRIGVEQLSEQLSQRTLEVAMLERQLKAESEQLAKHKLQIAKIEEFYAAEIEAHKSQIARQEKHYTAEVAELQGQLKAQTEELRNKSVSLAELTERLRKQLWDTRRLSHLLGNVEKAAARLRTSRRWKLANPRTAIKSKLSHGKVSMGYGHLEKIVKAYSEWRASHPEIGKIDDAIKAAEPQKE